MRSRDTGPNDRLSRLISRFAPPYRFPGTHGVLGPNFDRSEKLTEAQIRGQLDLGVGGMPSFRGRLSPKQEDAVAAFLSAAMRRRH